MRAVVVAAGVALLIALLGTPAAIRVITALRAGQPIRADGPQGHLVKQGTPTMGGLVIILATLIAYGTGLLALTTLPQRQIARSTPTATGVLLLGLMVCGGFLGFLDDFLKVRRRNSGGLSERGKLLGQILVGAAFGSAALYFPGGNGETVGSTTLSAARDIPWLDLGRVAAVVLFILLVMSTTNGVNITDGLDGLATAASLMVFTGYLLIAFWQYRHWCADTGYVRAMTAASCYQVRDPLEIALVAGAAAGACLGFLWWNAWPARIIMGDTGSMALGGLIAGMAIATRTVLLLPIIGLLYVIITMSVVIQRLSYKLTGRRVLRMSPLHHHFELAGWSEVTIVIRFWIIAGIGVVIALGLFAADYLRTMG